MKYSQVLGYAALLIKTEHLLFTAKVSMGSLMNRPLSASMILDQPGKDVSKHINVIDHGGMAVLLMLT